MLPMAASRQQPTKGMQSITFTLGICTICWWCECKGERSVKPLLYGFKFKPMKIGLFTYSSIRISMLISKMHLILRYCSRLGGKFKLA